jgi:acetyltransferase EpsM
MNNILVGYSGHALVVAEAFIENNNTIQFYTELVESDFNPFNLKYLGDENSEKFTFWNNKMNYILGIGNNFIRERSAKLILKHKNQIITVIHPFSSISNKALIGCGVFISKGVLVNPFVNIGDFTILNTGCIIEHECEIGNAVHIAPGAVLAGNVKIGNRTFIGANSVIKQGVEIGDDVIIGAGSVVLNNVVSHSKIVGNPGRVKK